MGRDTTWVVCLAGALGLCAGPAPAGAQTAIGDGRALENNMRQGSGGANQPVPPPDYSGRNALMTGNVPGLGYFHGDVGYRAPGDFQGRLADDALFRFRAQSIAGNPAMFQPSGAVVQDPRVYGEYLQSRPTVYRALSPALTPTPAMDYGSGRVLTPTGLVVHPGAGSGPPQPLTGAEAVRGGGFWAVEGGRAVEMEASPLLGLRRPALPPAPAEPLGAAPLPGAGSDVWQQRVTPLGIALGAEIQARLPVEPLANNPRLDERVAQIEAQMLRPLGSRSVLPGEDVYLDILNQIRAQGQQARGQTPAGGTGALPPEQWSGAGGPATPTAPLPRPSAEQLAGAERARVAAMRRAWGLAAEPEPGAGAREGAGREPVPDGGPKPPRLPTLTDPEWAAGQVEAGELPQSLDQLVREMKLPAGALRTLAGTATDRVNDWLRQAEGDLAADRYFAAETKYRLVLDTTPGHVMARVGQLHAQLGAGMLRTAAYNLRRLMEDHPELIAVRYDGRLLPNDQRMRWLREQIEEEIKLSTTRTEPALLLAYVGRQFHTPELVQYGLDLAQSRDPRDPLWPLLRRLWLEAPAARPGAAAPAGGPTTAPAPSPAPALP